MPLLTIEVTDEVEAALRMAATREGRPAEAVAAERLAASFDAGKAKRWGDADAEIQAWWDSLTEEQREAERGALARGLADLDTGRTKSEEEVFDRIRAKYRHLHPTPPG